MQPLFRFLIAYGAALAVAASIGKLVPHVRWLAERFDASLAGAGLAISAVMFAGALAGPFVGWVVDRFGARPMTIAGLALGALAAVLLPLAQTYAALCALRIVEGVGYSVAVVGATLIVIAQSTPQRRMLALGMFSSFAPIGFALGQWLGGYADPTAPLAAVGAVHAAVLVGFAVLIALNIPASPGESGAPRGFQWRALAHRPALRSSLAFGCMTGVLLGAVTLTPLVLAEVNRLPVAEAARLAALAALPGVLGRFAAGWLLEQHGLRPLAVIIGAAVVGAAALGVAFDPRIPLAGALGCVAIFQICIGALPGVISALLAHVARVPGELGTVTGLANQMIQVGNLVGPPVALGAYAAGGTTVALGLIALAIVAAVLLVAGIPVYRRPVSSVN